jgi:hypothetical protein
MLIFIYMLLLPEGQTSEVWEPSKSSALSEIGGHWTEVYFHFLYVNYSDLPLTLHMLSQKRVTVFGMKLHFKATWETFMNVRRYDMIFINSLRVSNLYTNTGDQKFSVH